MTMTDQITCSIITINLISLRARKERAETYPITNPHDPLLIEIDLLDSQIEALEKELSLILK